MQKDQSDLGLIFRKRARRRLVGAIALVLLMVILLPRVLEDRAQTNTQQDIAIVMPDGSGASDVVVSEELITLEDLKAEAAANTKKST
ncbi:MAG: sporulation protein, partial [Methylophilaceae bacterium]